MRLFCTISVAALVVAAGALGATLRAQVRLAATSPVRIAGLHFFPREAVAVTVARRVHRTTSHADGSFSVEFPDVSLGRCGGGFFVRAVGARGDVASIKIPLPACMPAAAP